MRRSRVIVFPLSLTPGTYPFLVLQAGDSALRLGLRQLPRRGAGLVVRPQHRASLVVEARIGRGIRSQCSCSLMHGDPAFGNRNV